MIRGYEGLKVVGFKFDGQSKIEDLIEIDSVFQRRVKITQLAM